MLKPKLAGSFSKEISLTMLTISSPSRLISSLWTLPMEVKFREWAQIPKGSCQSPLMIHLSPPGIFYAIFAYVRGECYVVTAFRQCFSDSRCIPTCRLFRRLRIRRRHRPPHLGQEHR